MTRLVLWGQAAQTPRPAGSGVEGKEGALPLKQRGIRVDWLAGVREGTLGLREAGSLSGVTAGR